MCHRGTDWSRTTSKASESEDDREAERSSWTTRAKTRLAAFVSGDETDESAPSAGETDEREPDETPRGPDETPREPPTAEVSPESDESETDEEREEEPILAD